MRLLSFLSSSVNWSKERHPEFLVRPRGNLRKQSPGERGFAPPSRGATRAWALTFSRRAQCTSEATRPSHHGSSILASSAPRSEATGLPGRSLRGHGFPQTPLPVPPRPGQPYPRCPPPGTPPAHPGGAGGHPQSREGLRCPFPSVGGTWGGGGRPGAVQTTTCRIFIFPFCKSCTAKLPTSLAQPRRRLGLP